MKLTKYSADKLMNSLATHNVPKDWSESIYNYLVHGFQPGSFLTHLLSNDAMGMIGSSHPMNKIDTMKCLVQWLSRCPVGVFHGSRKAVESWMKKSPKQRRKFLETHRIIYTEQEEIMLVLKEEPRLHVPFEDDIPF